MLIDGVDLSRASQNRLAEMRNEKIGFVFQAFNLLSKFTVLQNVELPMIYSSVPARERKQRALDAIERVQLSHRVKNTPLQLSGGQMQRVAIARALFKELSQQGRTIVLVTHDNNIAARTPRRIEICDGQIVHDGANLPTHLEGIATAASG
jgi:putative ABC transport system ATP-binding protein